MIILCQGKKSHADVMTLIRCCSCCCLLLFLLLSCACVCVCVVLCCCVFMCVLLVCCSFEQVTAGMKPASTKKEAIERFQQLDEQLRVIENGAKAVEGGLRNSNKVQRGGTSGLKGGEGDC